MNRQVKRTVYMILIAVILFSATMAIPAIHHSKMKDVLQGGAIGLMFAGIISFGIVLYERYFKKA